ncbi:MAG: signal recognition particle protein [Spirochaetales bacterium]|nr:signal recognition particle protein [Spirochaetales bacterium]
MLDRITEKFTDIFRQVSGKAVISEKNIEDTVNEIKVALLEADVNVRVVRRFVNHTIEEARGEKVLKAVNPGQLFTKIVYDRMVSLLGDERQDLDLKGPDTVSCILMMGLQGSGKTTSAAKLGVRLKKEGRKPLLVAADLVRPAAVEQLAILGSQGGVDVYREEGSSALTVAKNGYKHAKKQLYDTVIFDTTGRLHIDEEMMAEIAAMAKAVDPVEALLVADAMTGQHAVDIAKEFDERVGITGVILSKFDSDARGGAALSLKSITGKPIKFIGTGEKLDQLEVFYPERIASRILGMGDVVSLVEKAQETIDRKEAEVLEKKLAKATFTLEDYLDSFARVRKMGSLQSLIEMVPGAAGKISEDDLDDKQMKQEEAIILSMTRQERNNHRIIGPSRRKRIARGSGTSVYDVNRLLKKFEKMRLTMKKMVKNKKYQAEMMSRLNG